MFLPDGGEVEVIVRHVKPREELELSKFSEEDRKKLEALGPRLCTLANRYRTLEERGASEAEVARARVEFHELFFRVQRLEQTRRASLDRFPVRITGLSGRDGWLLTAEYGGYASTERWRAVVSSGEARFPALFAGTWRLILDAPGTSVMASIEIRAGRAAAAVAFPFPPQSAPGSSSNSGSSRD